MFYLSISPWILGFLVFLFGPMVASIYLSFTDWDSFTAPKFVGLANYIRLSPRTRSSGRPSATRFITP